MNDSTKSYMNRTRGSNFLQGSINVPILAPLQYCLTTIYAPFEKMTILLISALLLIKCSYVTHSLFNLIERDFKKHPG